MPGHTPHINVPGGSASRRRWQGPALGTLAVLSFLLCIGGFLALDGGRDLLEWRNWSDAIYQSIRIWSFEYDGPKAPNEVPIALHIGRLGAMVSLLWASWIAALILLRERTTPLRLWFNPADVAFCGVTDDILRIAAAQKRCTPGLRMALITPDPYASLVQLFRQDVSRLIVAGDPVVTENLIAGRTYRARRCIYVAGVTDPRTVQIVDALVQLVNSRSKKRTRPLQIVALLSDRSLLGALPDSLQQIKRDRVELSWVDPAAVAARVMLERLAPDSIVTAAAQRIHVLIFGSTALCEGLILLLVRNVYARQQVTRITVVAADAEAFRSRLFARYPALAPDFADQELYRGIFPLVDLRFLAVAPATWSDRELASCQSEAPLTCAFAHLGNDDATVLATHRLQQLLARAELELRIAGYFDQVRDLEGVTAVIANRDVFHCRPTETYLGEYLDQAAVLHHFAYDPNNRIPELEAPAAEHDQAKIAAERQWRETPEWQRDSSRHVADHIAVKLRQIGFVDLAAGKPIDLPTAARLESTMAERLEDLEGLEHRRYCVERMLAGWLPVDAQLWNPVGAGQTGQAASQALRQHRDRLKSLRLNATLVASVEQHERYKDQRLVSSTAWILFMDARRDSVTAD